MKPVNYRKQAMSRSFWLIDLLFRKIFRQNVRVGWAVHHTTTIHHPQKLHVGVGTFPGDSPGVYINANNGVYVGDFTNIGPQVGIISSNHGFEDNDQDCTSFADSYREVLLAGYGRESAAGGASR